MARRKKEEVQEVENLEPENSTQEIALESTESAPDSTTDGASDTEDTETQPKPRKPRRRRRSKTIQLDSSDASIETDKEESNTSEDLVTPTYEATTRHWLTIKEITTHIARELERVSLAAKELPQVPIVPNDSSPTRSLRERISLVASIVAVVISIVSLSLSQSARQFVLSHDNTAATNPQPIVNETNSEIALKPLPNKAKAKRQAK